MENLERTMRVRGMNQTDLARLLKVNQKTVSDWITGEYSPKPRRYHDLALFLGTSVEHLVDVIDQTSKKRHAA